MTAPNHAWDDELLSGYLDGELAPEDRAFVEARLAGDEQARQQLAELVQLREGLRSLPVPDVHPDLAARIMARLEAAGGPTPPSTPGAAPLQHGWRRGAIWAAAILAASVVLLLWQPEWGQEAQQVAKQVPAPAAAPGAREPSDARWDTSAAGGGVPANGPVEGRGMERLGELRQQADAAPSALAERNESLGFRSGNEAHGMRGMIEGAADPPEQAPPAPASAAPEADRRFGKSTEDFLPQLVENGELADAPAQPGPADPAPTEPVPAAPALPRHIVVDGRSLERGVPLQQDVGAAEAPADAGHPQPDAENLVLPTNVLFVVQTDNITAAEQAIESRLKGRSWNFVPAPAPSSEPSRPIMVSASAEDVAAMLQDLEGATVEQIAIPDERLQRQTDAAEPSTAGSHWMFATHRFTLNLHPNVEANFYALSPPAAGSTDSMRRSGDEESEQLVAEQTESGPQTLILLLPATQEADAE